MNASNRWYAALGIGLALMMAVAQAPAQAPGYPSRPIRIVVPSSAGGPTDAGARIVAEKMAADWGQPVVVDNRPGGNNIIGTENVASSPPDGYTLLLALDSTMTMHPSLYKKLPYDPLKDFTPVALGFWSPILLITDAAKGPKSVKDLLDQARANPGRSTVGVGTLTSQLSGEMLKSQAGVNIMIVPYKGSAGTTQGLLSNDVTFTIDAATTSMPYIKNGRFRVLANLGDVPLDELPGIPSFAKESGLADFNVGVWLGFLAPAGTPPAIVEKLNLEINRIIAMPDVKDKLKSVGLEAAGGSPAEFASFIRTESDKWSKVIKTSGFKID